jgi:aryl-alcohol dehydrogenase-like predicted oxidoreductase
MLPHRPLGTSRLQVPVIGLGCSSFGATVGAARATRIVHAALDAGICLFDTAPAYADGRSEEMLGRALRGRRDRALVGTKFGSRTRADSGRQTASAGQIRSEVEASLRRLATDHLDLYYLHAPDPMTPWAEILQTLDRLAAAGKIRFAGCCNISGEQLVAAGDTAAGHGLAGFAAVQNEYNVLRRRAESDSLPVCSRLGVGFLAYFPLAGGLLAGTYATPAAPERSTVARTSNRRLLSADTIATVQALQRGAARLGRSLLEVALAVPLARPEVTGLIVGATTRRQVRDDAAAARWRPTAADLAAMAQLLAADRRPA